MATSFSRRNFLGYSLAAAAVNLKYPRASTSTPTARDLIGRLKTAFGPMWRETATDAFHAGDPDTPVTGIATTVMATFDVLKRAAASGKNLIITHEPTFWTGNDNLAGLEDDPLLTAKQEFIASRRLAVFRFHDNWHGRRPEPMTKALAEALKWDNELADDPGVYVIPTATLADVARHVRSSLQIHAARVIGASAMRVTRVGFLPGTPPSNISAARLFRKVDLIIAGEQREWEGVYYAYDLASTGQAKAMITVGHAISEDPGMRLCADWLRTFLMDVPVTWIPAGEPFAS